MKKLQQSEDVPKVTTSNVNNLPSTSYKKVNNFITEHENMCDEDFVPSADASVSWVSTASQTSTLPYQPLDENLNISLDVSQRASNLVDKLMKIVDDEVERDCGKDIDALACVLLDKTGKTFNLNTSSSIEVESITSVHCQTRSVINNWTENGSHSGILTPSSNFTRPSGSSLTCDVDEAWLQKLDSINESSQNTPDLSMVNSSKNAKTVKNVGKTTTLQIPRASMSVTVTNPLKEVHVTDMLLKSSKPKHVTQEGSAPNVEFCAQKNVATEDSILECLPTNQSYSENKSCCNFSDNKRIAPIPEQPCYCPRKPGMHQGGKHKKCCLTNHLGPSQPSGKGKSCSEGGLGATQVFYKEHDSSATDLLATQILINNNTNSKLENNASSCKPFNSGEEDPGLEGEHIKASLGDMPDFAGHPLAVKDLNTKQSDMYGASNNTMSCVETKPPVQAELGGNKHDDCDTCVENEALSEMQQHIKKSEKNHEAGTTISEELNDNEVADTEKNKQFTTNKSSMIDLNTSQSQMNPKSGSGMHPKVKSKKGVLEPLPALSSYPSLGPGPAAVPNTGHKYVGAHISAAGGIHNVFSNARAINAKSFAMFMRSQRQWAAKPFLEEHVSLFKELGKDFPKHLILPHGSYLMNVGSSKPDLLEKSRALLVEELDRCLQLGIPHFNFHPGSCVGGSSREACCRTIAESINIAHAKVPQVIVVLENMCKQGNTIGGDFLELRHIIEHVKDRTRIGICIDTCHAHNAGYDLATEEGFNSLIEDFKKIIGFQFLRGLHINDSKNEAGAHVDRHECIGKGHIGTAGMRRVMNCELFNDLPLILETPYTDDEGYAKEIKMLECMIHEMKQEEPTNGDLIQTQDAVSCTSKNNPKQKRGVVSKKRVASDENKIELDPKSDVNKDKVTKNRRGTKRTRSASKDDVRKEIVCNEKGSEPDKKDEKETTPKRLRQSRGFTGVEKPRRSKRN
ncbi:AP endonuclease 2 [Trinorchestia longiramus]|nr:AP endonuclease 2 [Trinorchestia longiramus]